MRFLRSLVAVLAGFGIFWAALHFIPTGGLPTLLTVTVLASILAGYVTSLIAGIYEFPHSSMVGMLMIGSAFVSMLQSKLTAPGQYQIVLAGCGPVSALFGAAIRFATKRRTRRPPRGPASHSPQSESPSNP